MKASSLPLLLILAFSQLFAQETKKELVLTETFAGDTFDNVFSLSGSYTG